MISTPAFAVIPTEADLAPPDAARVVDEIRETLGKAERLLALDPVPFSELESLKADLAVVHARLDRIPAVTDPQVTTRSRNLVRQARRPLEQLQNRLTSWQGGENGREDVQLALETLLALEKRSLAPPAPPSADDERNG